MTPTATVIDHPVADEAVLADRVAERLRRVQALLAVAEKNTDGCGGVEFASAAGEVVAVVDPGGRLVWLSVAPQCMTRYTTGQLQELINNTVLSAVGWCIR